MGEIELTEEQQEAIAKILGFAVFERIQHCTDVENVTIYDKQAAYNGLNSVVSADAPKAFLMDMPGNVLHEWQLDFKDVWPESYTIEVPEVYKSYWRRAYLREQGDVLAMFYELRVGKIGQGFEPPVLL